MSLVQVVTSGFSLFCMRSLDEPQNEHVVELSTNCCGPEKPCVPAGTYVCICVTHIHITNMWCTWKQMYVCISGVSEL